MIDEMTNEPTDETIVEMTNEATDETIVEMTEEMTVGMIDETIEETIDATIDVMIDTMIDEDFLPSKRNNLHHQRQNAGRKEVLQQQITGELLKKNGLIRK